MLLQNVIESQHLAPILPIIACDFKRKDKLAPLDVNNHRGNRRAPLPEEREGGTKFFDNVPKGIYNAGY
jgi:hypothetical protein